MKGTSSQIVQLHEMLSVLRGRGWSTMQSDNFQKDCQSNFSSHIYNHMTLSFLKAVNPYATHHLISSNCLIIFEYMKGTTSELYRCTNTQLSEKDLYI